MHVFSKIKLARFVIFFIMINPPDSLSQRTEAQIREILTKGNREWKLDSTRTWLSKKCKSGEFLNFYNSPALVVKRVCDVKVQQFVQKNLNWSLTNSEKSGWLISIGDTTYRLIILEELNRVKLILRHRESNTNIRTSTKDKFYTSYK
jgi:hypothetical protein